MSSSSAVAAAYGPITYLSVSLPPSWSHCVFASLRVRCPPPLARSLARYCPSHPIGPPPHSPPSGVGTETERSLARERTNGAATNSRLRSIHYRDLAGRYRERGRNIIHGFTLLEWSGGMTRANAAGGLITQTWHRMMMMVCDCGGVTDRSPGNRCGRGQQVLPLHHRRRLWLARARFHCHSPLLLRRRGRHKRDFHSHPSL